MGMTIPAAMALVTRQAMLLGDPWQATAGSEDAWGVSEYQFAELGDGQSSSIRIWVNGAEAMLSAEIDGRFEESSVEIWGLDEGTVESAVSALAREDFELTDSYVIISSGQREVRLTRWSNGVDVPGITLA